MTSKSWWISEGEVFCFHATLSPSTEGSTAVRYGSHVLVAEGGGWWRRAQQWTRQCGHNVVCQEVRVWTDGCEKFVSHEKMEQRKEREVGRNKCVWGGLGGVAICKFATNKFVEGIFAFFKSKTAALPTLPMLKTVQHISARHWSVLHLSLWTKVCSLGSTPALLIIVWCKQAPLNTTVAM